MMLSCRLAEQSLTTIFLVITASLLYSSTGANQRRFGQWDAATFLAWSALVAEPGARLLLNFILAAIYTTANENTQNETQVDPKTACHGKQWRIHINVPIQEAYIQLM